MFTLRENEKIIKVARQHGSVLFKTIFLAVLIVGALIFIFLKYNFNILGYSWSIVIASIVIASIIVLYKIHFWRKNALIITNQRVMLLNKNGFFSRTITELLYKDIYDISIKQVGILAIMNRYGKIMIHTPSRNNIIFDKISSPTEVVRIINEIRGNNVLK
jgi:membrane protein YdbS with pleckstrin-like domain